MFDTDQLDANEIDKWPELFSKSGATSTKINMEKFPPWLLTNPCKVKDCLNGILSQSNWTSIRSIEMIGITSYTSIINQMSGLTHAVIKGQVSKRPSRHTFNRLEYASITTFINNNRSTLQYLRLKVYCPIVVWEEIMTSISTLSCNVKATYIYQTHGRIIMALFERVNQIVQQYGCEMKQLGTGDYKVVYRKVGRLTKSAANSN